ncbi:MAG: hypothetical protein QXP68_04535 [Thermosphaera sp.]
MSEEGVPIMINKSFRGDLHIDFRNSEISLGGGSAQKVTIPIGLPNRNFTPIQLGILEMIVESPDNKIDWKVKVNGINVTKEFKPMFTAEVDSTRLFKFVFDITSILNVDESMGKNWVNITLKHEGGSPFSIKNIMLLTIYESEDGVVELNYRSGLARIKPGEKIKIKDADARSFSNIKIIYGSSSKEVTPVLLVGEKPIRLSLHNSFEEYDLTANEKESIYLAVEDGAKGLKSRYVLLSSVISYISVMKTPVLEATIENVKIDHEKIELEFTLKNTGESSPDSLVYTVLHKGQTIYVEKETKTLPPGSELHKRILLKSPEALNQFVLRIVWRKLTKTWFQDLNITASRFQ